jgi:hypothetical protein
LVCGEDYKNQVIDGIFHQLGRFFWWIQQGGNSNLVLVGITALYAFLTYLLLRWNTIQARSQFQPQLRLSMFFTDVDQKRGTFRIGNTGNYTVVVLDVELSCRMNGKVVVRNRAELLQDALISSDDHIGMSFDFCSELESAPKEMFTYVLVVVGADVARRMPMTYQYLPLFNLTTAKMGQPLYVTVRRWASPLSIAYHRIVHWFRDRFSR